MKRKIVLLFAVVLSVSLVACGKNETGSVTETSNEVTDIIPEQNEPTSQDKPADYNKEPAALSKPNKYFKVKFDDATNLTMSGNSVLGFDAQDADGNIIHFMCVDTELDGKTLVVSDGGYILNTTPIPGIRSIETTFDDGIGFFTFGGGVIAYNEEVNGVEDVMMMNTHITGCDTPNYTDTLYGNPSYIYIRGGAEYEEESVLRLSDFKIGYMDEGYCTPKEAIIDTYSYNFYVEGDYYDASREYNDIESQDYCFSILVSTGEAISHYDYGSMGIDIPMEKITVGDLYDKDGNLKDKENDPLAVGDYLMLTIAGYDIKMELPVNEKAYYKNMREARGVETTQSTGDIRVLVVPVYLTNQADEISEDSITNIKKSLGRVMDTDGNITDYSGDNATYSLSEYFDIASYGKANITSFIADWMPIDGYFYYDTYEQLWDENITEIESYINNNYPNVVGKLDADGNDIFDSVIIVCAFSGETMPELGYSTISYNGAYQQTQPYNASAYPDDGKVNIGSFVFLNERMLYADEDKATKQLCNKTLLHEFSHSFGLIDYYDTLYSGINTVGSYDMQSDSVGDWNAYSKFACGWIKPTVVDPSKVTSEGITVSIDSFGKTGDCVIIPTEKTKIDSDGTISPFSEYILIELFTGDGVDEKFVSDYGLDGVSGVRIYHVGASMGKMMVRDSDNLGRIRRLLGYDPIIYIYNGRENDYFGSEKYYSTYNTNGYYNIELIQAGGINTFTTMGERVTLDNSDFFYAGNSFSVEKYGDFFNNGLMDDRTEFPYSITIKSIENGKATIVITK